MQLLKIIRFNSWWMVIPPQVLGWIYFCLLVTHGTLQAEWPRILLFFTALVATSSFGYLLNDFFDVASDKVAGKKNALAGFNYWLRLLFVVLPLLLGIGAWVLLKIPGLGANALFALQIVALTVYSAPPLRLKERSAMGIVADAFYGHINPAFIALTAFVPGYSQMVFIGLLVFALIFVCTTLKGLRNILLHQLDDRKKDNKAGTNTFVRKNGALFTLYFINNLLPFEIFFTVALCVAISYIFPPFLLSILIFAVLTYLKFSGWKLPYLPKRQLKFKFLHFLNDYYEGWIPVFFLLLLSVRSADFLILLVLHLVLFPSFVIKLWHDLQTIAQNFKTEDDY
ncbi:MAG TPA: UbiA family prenyltransferase [Chitinophagales bacterium]|nr:UbiA family prenyltransferase [Chitinophagales bacterium]